jgi:hypothetical protein
MTFGEALKVMESEGRQGSNSHFEDFPFALSLSKGVWASTSSA